MDPDPGLVRILGRSTHVPFQSPGAGPRIEINIKYSTTVPCFLAAWHRGLYLPRLYLTSFIPHWNCPHPHSGISDSFQPCILSVLSIWLQHFLTCTSPPGRTQPLTMSCMILLLSGNCPNHQLLSSGNSWKCSHGMHMLHTQTSLNPYDQALKRPGERTSTPCWKIHDKWYYTAYAWPLPS